jgi:ECF sigma factor
VHEWYLRFVESSGPLLQDRVQFMRYAGRVMRSVIVDFARRRLAGRRGGGALHISLTQPVAEGVAAGEQQILRVHEALR